MAEIKNRDEKPKKVVGEILVAFSEISEAAKFKLDELRASSAPDTSTLVDNDFMAAGNPAGSVMDARRTSVADYESLCSEPAYARVVAVDKEGKEIILYVCRKSSAGLSAYSRQIAGYLSPMGQLAELPVGESETVRRGGKKITFTVLESATFTPALEHERWDTTEAELEGSEYSLGPVISLRAYLEGHEDISTPLSIEQWVKEEPVAENEKRRSIITHAALRDRPILDWNQGKIFRLPLDSRLLLTGAPGTGKTTTLIKRLGQKLHLEFLEEDERKEINALMREGEVNYPESWLMFAPTNLLKHYVKEAFNREGVPASDKRIITWDDHRDDLARSEFQILRSASNKSSLVIRKNAHIINPISETEPENWFADFDAWQKLLFAEELRTAAKNLSENGSASVAKIGTRLAKVLGEVGSTLRPNTFVTLMEIANDVQEIVRGLKATSDKEIHAVLNKLRRTDSSFLENLVSFVEREKISEINDDSEEESADIDDEDDENQPRTGRRSAALTSYMQAVRTQARAKVRGRSIRRSTHARRLIDWLGDRTLPADKLEEVGESLILQAALRRFTNPVRLYVNGVTSRYRKFRREHQSQSSWYRTEGFSPTDIHPLEIDIILLSMIWSTDELIKEARSLLNRDTPAKLVLERLNNLRRMQVIVDEATDFSPVQLACMAALAHPQFRSFFACGDFNQRVTRWGTRSLKQIEWAIPNIDVHTVNSVYRQSRLLLEFSEKISALSDDAVVNINTSGSAKHEGVPPVIASQIQGAKAVQWLASRIREIENPGAPLPSVAVLVNSEDEISFMESSLGDELAENNIFTMPCPNGQVLGSERKVRVFNIQHIKGLEFEAVFFVGLDKLAEKHPDLFDKYLYVGATRAATYLGVTCEGELPDKLSELKELFGENWA